MRFSIRSQENSKDTQVAEASSIEEAITIICKGSFGNTCIVIWDTKNNKYITPDQKMLKRLYRAKK